jgi:hypothetical protein
MPYAAVANWGAADMSDEGNMRSLGALSRACSVTEPHRASRRPVKSRGKAVKDEKLD